MTAAFRVDGTFTITHRGLGLAGEVVEGAVRIGDRVALPDPAAPDGIRLERITG